MHTHAPGPFSGPLELLLAIVRAADGGPVYTETDFSRTIVEPLNALSAALFIGIVALFGWRLRGNWRSHRQVAYMLPVLLVGGLGGTIYHAFRMNRVFLIMDWFPIVVLVVWASIHFMRLLGAKWWLVGAVFASGMGFSSTLFRLVQAGLIPLDMGAAISVNYGMMGVTVSVPILLYLRRRRWQHGRWLGCAGLCFAVALFFRYFDSYTELTAPNGTHWLWHVFGASAVVFALELLWRLELPQQPVQAIVGKMQ